MTRLTRAESQNITRQKIRDAALREISTSGYAAASVDRIAAAAGFSKGAFYANYPSKQDLMLELMREIGLQENAAQSTLLEVCDDLDAIYHELVARFDAFLMKADWGLLMAEIQLQAKRDKTFGAAYRRYQNEARRCSDEFFKTLFAKAGKQLPIPVAVATSMLHNLVTGIYLNAESNKSANISENAAEMMMIFLKGLMAMAAPLPRPASRRTPRAKSLNATER
jgi:AcrR family transcriptional regulator